MPIKPIDFQIMIPRTMDASKSQNDDFSKLLNVQKVANSSLQQESDKGLRQVQHREKSYKTNINKDGRGSQRQEQEKKEHEEKQDTGEGKSSDSGNNACSSVHIDIKI